MKFFSAIFAVLAVFASILAFAVSDTQPALAQTPGPGEYEVTVAGSSATLVWGAVDGVSVYQIRSSNADGSFSWRETVSDGFTWVDDDSRPGEEYLVRYRLGGVQDILCTTAADGGGGEPPVDDPPGDGGGDPGDGPAAGECVVTVAGLSLIHI